MFVFITGCSTLFHFLPASKSNSSLSLPLSFLYAALYHVLPLLSWQIRKKKLLLRKPWAFKRNFRNCLYFLLMYLTVNFFFPFVNRRKCLPPFWSTTFTFPNFLNYIYWCGPLSFSACVLLVSRKEEILYFFPPQIPLNSCRNSFLLFPLEVA